jgi:hypothetical protein
LATFLAPGVDLVAVGDGELDLVEGDRVAVVGFGFAVHELFVVGLFVLFVEAGGEAEVGELDVSATIEEDVIGFDVTGDVSICGGRLASSMHLPMNETKLMDSFYSQD